MSRFRPSVVTAALLLSTATVALALPQATSAAAVTRVDVDLRHDLGRTLTDTVPLTLAGNGLDEATLDWRTPVQVFDIDLAPSDWVEAADLTLWADPLAPSDAERRSGRDILVSLNGGEAQLVRLTRKGFSARIPLPLADVRPGTNRVRVELARAGGVSCLTASDGGWTLDLSRSRFDTVARARSRSVFLSEVRQFLSRPTSQPLMLGIRAYGDDTLGTEALIAQGLAMRTHHLPRFAVGADARRADFTVLAGTRLALSGMVSDKAVLDGTGARIAVHEGRPLRLVLTGDTEDEVRASVRAFSTRELPDVRRRIASPTALDFAGTLDAARPEAGRRTRLSSLGGFDFSSNWGAGADAVTFDAHNAQGARGRLVLDLDRSDAIAPESHVDIRLNGRDLGRVRLAEATTEADIAVPQGWLRTRGNRLEMRPVLSPAVGGCAPELSGAGIRVRKASRLEITPAPTPAYGDLSRLAAADSPLNSDGGAGTTVIVPKSAHERAYALRILGNIARGAGQSLHAAKYATDVPETGDLLVVGEAGRSLDVPRPLAVALSERRRGSVAALYPDGGRWVGVIAPDRAGSLGGTANAFDVEALNDLSGGIARIDGGRVEVAHIAFDGGSVPSIARPVFDAQSFHIDAAELGYALEAELDTSLSTLRGAWSRMEIPPILRRASSGLEGETALRGPFEAPRANIQTLTLADASGGQRAGLSLREMDESMGRAARRIRAKFGLKPVSAKTRWAWGDRNMSFMAMLLMLAFSLSVVGLARADSRP